MSIGSRNADLIYFSMTMWDRLSNIVSLKQLTFFLKIAKMNLDNLRVLKDDMRHSYLYTHYNI